MSEVEDTLFENADIDIQALPNVATSNFNPLAGNYFWVIFFRANLIFLALSIGFFIFLLQSGEVNGIKIWAYLIGGFTAFWLFLNIFLPFSFRKKGFSIRERDIIYKSGLWWTKIIVIPFNRIQHCEVQQGPFSKIFGLKSLTVFTAGGGSSDLKVNGLPDNKADQLKEFVLTKITNEDE